VKTFIHYVDMSARIEASGQERWRLLAWPFRHIRWKIVLPYLFLTVLLAVVGSYLATELVTGSLEERFDNQLAEAGRGVSDKVVRKEREHLGLVRAVAFRRRGERGQSGDKDRLNSLVSRSPRTRASSGWRCSTRGATG
jgi:hypothetical protein